jgi:hypothetical protein
MTDTISHPTPPLEDVRVVAARKALAELPEAEDNERPYFWVGRLKMSLTALLAAWPPGARGGLDNGQREVLGSALADALRFRDPVGGCEECERRDSGLCDDHAADLDLCDAYLYLARELGIEVEQ